MKMKTTFLFTTLVLLGTFLKSNGQQNSNTVLGSNAPGTPSEKNVLLGQGAGANLTTQPNGLNGSNVFIGYESGTNANSAVGVGENARNTFVGTFSGLANTTGSDNIFMGFGAGKLNTTGDKNIFIKSLRENTNNTGIPMTGSGNTMVGYQTGDYMQAGSYNTFYGNSAGRFNTSGNYNLFLGYNAGYSNVSGNQNVCLGIGANQNALEGSGSNNVYIGSYASRHNNGNQNTIIGPYSGQNLTLGNGNTFLGYVQVPYALSSAVTTGYDTSSTIILADGIGNQRLLINRNGNTGIGLGNNVIPVNKLDVKGGVTIGENYTPRLLPTPVAGAVAPANGLLVEGKVGIGNTLPKNKLEITHGTDGNSGLRFTNLTSDYNPPVTAQASTKFLSVNATGDVILQKMPSEINTNALSSNANLMTSNVSGISASAPIVNSISNNVTANNLLVTTVNGVSSSPVSLPFQTLSQSENTVTLSNGGGSITLPIDTDAQSLSLVGNNLSIYNGNTVVLPSQVPQTLSQTGNTVTLSNGGGSFTMPTLTDTDAQSLTLSGNNLSISNGNTVTLPVTNIVAGNNVTITGNGLAATPYQINATDKSIYSTNGTINQASTTNGNRVVTMNSSNIWFKSSASETNGKIYIGNTATYPTATGSYRLLVEGGILTEKVKVALRSTANWADYVFNENYKLMPLDEVAKYVAENKHLPGVDSAESLAKNGLDVAEMQSKQMEKIEELTLYIIDQDKKMAAQNAAIEKQNATIEELKMQVQALIEKTK